MNNPLKKKVTSGGETNREFIYSTSRVHLKFTSRTDVKSQLKDFLELLKVATKEVEEELTKI